MSQCGLGVAAFAGVLALASLPLPALAQQCEGNPPKGGKYITSAEIYIDLARRKPKSEDKIRLYNQAVEVLTQGFERQPENPRNYVMAGQAHIGLEEFESANGMWEQAESMWTCYHTELDSLRYDAWVRAFNLGIRYSNNDEIDKARDYFAAAYTVYDQLPQPIIQLASFYAREAQESADPEQADEARQKAIDLYRTALATLESPRLSDEDRAQYGHAAYFNLAQFLAFDERFDAAATAYEEFLSIDPDNATAKSNAAVVLMMAADQLADKAADMEEGEEKAAVEAQADGFRERASAHYADLVAREDLEAEEYHDIGVGLARARFYEGALVAFTHALDLEPYRASSLEQLGFVLFASEQYDSLTIVGAALVERYPLNMNNLAMLANAYRETEQSEKALVILQRREDLKVEIERLEMTSEEGVYLIQGVLLNIGLEPGAQIDLQFDLRDDGGEIAGSATRSFEAPEQGAAARIEVEIKSCRAVEVDEEARGRPGAVVDAEVSVEEQSLNSGQPVCVEVPVSGFTYTPVGPGEDATGT